VHIRETFQPLQPSLEQRPRPAHIPPTVVVERRRNLNNPLQKSFLRLSRSQPNFFPRFVRLKKEPPIELLDSAAKLFLMSAAMQVVWHSFTATARGRLGSNGKAKPL